MAALRNPDLTREKLLQAAFQEMYRSGFQAASLDTILAQAGVTKGALYYHFANKKALGYAVVDDVIRPMILQEWLTPLEDADNPIDALLQLLRLRIDNLTPEEYQLGCPLNNLAQEMSPIDEEFRQRLEEVFCFWRDGLTAIFQRGQARGHIRPDVDPAQVATFLLALFEGTMSLAKNQQNMDIFYACHTGLEQYFATLRT